MTTRYRTAQLLQTAMAPGLGKADIAQRLGITAVAVAEQIKHLRKHWLVLTTTDQQDHRIKRYRITGPKPGAPVQQLKPPRPAAPPKPALSATEVEALICKTIDMRHNKPMLIGNIIAATRLEAAIVRPALIAMVQRQTLLRKKAAYCRPPQQPTAITQTVATPRQVDVMTRTYTGAELRPFDGRPGAMAAYALPSRGMQV